MATVINNPEPGNREKVEQHTVIERERVTESGAGWAVAVIILLLLIAAGAYWWYRTYYRTAPADTADNANINITVPTGGNTNSNSPEY